ncbi:MAG: ATP-binding cassette domain-containing protein [Deltaproteobacteria bacterium]|nr:ATP-binding cassette domain-containing protein [Deltaproteobacteria bacterium]
MPEPTVAIEVSNVSKSYGGTRAVDRINFQVPRGQILGFLGPNGAGKTTTMKILTCFIAPSDGTARVNGHDVFTNPVEVRQSVGYLPESNPLYTEMTALEYLEFSAEMRGVGGDTGKLKKVVDATGLGDVLGKEIRAMSKGYRQRVGLAGAMVHEPPILILDEPMSGLDPNQASEIRDLIREIGKDRTVILSTHNLAEVTQTCNRVLIIARGKLVADDTPEALVKGAGRRVRYYVSFLKKPDVETAANSAEPWPEIASAAEVSKALAAAAKEASVTELPGDDGTYRFEMISSGSGDLRARIFHLAVEKRWTLMEMRREGQNLEEIFRGLTTDSPGGGRRSADEGGTKSEADES